MIGNVRRLGGEEEGERRGGRGGSEWIEVCVGVLRGRRRTGRGSRKSESGAGGGARGRIFEGERVRGRGTPPCPPL